MNSTGTSSRSNATPTPIRGGIVAYLGKEDDPSGQCPTASKVEVVEQVSVGMVRRQLPATAQVKFIVLAVTVTITASITDRTDQVLKLVLHTAFGGIAGGRIFRVNTHDQPIPPCFRPGVPVPVRPVCEPRARRSCQIEKPSTIPASAALRPVADEQSSQETGANRTVRKTAHHDVNRKPVLRCHGVTDLDSARDRRKR